jgi:sulfonate transport system substrate-binding protein
MGTSSYSDEFKRGVVQLIMVRGYLVREGFVAPRGEFALALHVARLFAEPAPKVGGADHEAWNRRLKRELARVTGTPDAAAAELSPSTGIPEEVLKAAISRQSFGVAPITDQVVADHQAVADTFAKLGLLPAPITVADAVVKL